MPQRIADDSSTLADLVVQRLEDSMKFFGGIPDISTGDAPKSTEDSDTSESEWQAGHEWLVPPAQIHVDIIVRTVVVIYSE